MNGEALIVRYSTRFAEALARIDANLPDAPAKLEAYVELYAKVLRAKRMCLCGILAAEFEPLPGPMRKAVVRFFDDNQAWLAGVLTRGQGEGSLSFRGTAVDAAQSLISGLEGAMLLARPYGDPSRFESAASRLLVSLVGYAGDSCGLRRVRCRPPGSDAGQPALVDDRHRSCRRLDYAVSAEGVQFSTCHLAHSAGGVSQSLMADMRDQTSAGASERYLAKMASDPHGRGLSGVVGKCAQSVRRQRCQVFRNRPLQLRVLCCRFSQVVDGEHRQGGVGDRLRIPLVAVGNGRSQADQITGARITDRQLPSEWCRDEHADHAGSHQRDLRTLFGGEDRRTPGDMDLLGASPEQVVPHPRFTSRGD
jgi:TetR/AcrR family transcriptional regulator, transcriptional repressor for nem operon